MLKVITKNKNKIKNKKKMAETAEVEEIKIKFIEFPRGPHTIAAAQMIHETILFQLKTFINNPHVWLYYMNIQSDALFGNQAHLTIDDFGKFHFHNMEELIEYAMNVIRIRGGSYSKSATLDEIDSADKNMMTTVIAQLAQFMALLKAEQRLEYIH